MSELKAFNMPRYAGQFTLHEVYLKSEADKVIANQKFKRCLAMAKWSKAGMYLSYECDFKREWWNKWQKRWLELAEKFKFKEA